MTATEIQNIARRLSNSSWCRYWLNYTDSEHPILAIQCRNGYGVPQPIRDAEKHGLKQQLDFLYTAPRTNEDGTPYVSKLFTYQDSTEA